MSATDVTIQKTSFHCPPLEEVAGVLQEGLKDNFEDVSVSVVECPDLTQKPFRLADKGLCGHPRLADVGGVPYLIPLVQRDKIYNLEKVAELAELPGALVVGAGAGPAHVEGVNAEMVANIQTQRPDREMHNNTHIIKVNTENGLYVQSKEEKTTDFCVLGNFYISEGKPGKVLEVKASHRKGKHNLMDALRLTLAKHYGSKPVGLGGTFLVEQGKANIHVMPDFSKVPLTSEEDVNNWLQFYEMKAPLTCLGYLVSHDPDLDLRIEHFHCFSEHGDGGHYHFDTTPDDVYYRGYFNVGEYMYRIDRPKVTHMIGRD